MLVSYIFVNIKEYLFANCKNYIKNPSSGFYFNVIDMFILAIRLDI